MNKNNKAWLLIFVVIIIAFGVMAQSPSPKPSISPSPSPIISPSPSPTTSPEPSPSESPSPEPSTTPTPPPIVSEDWKIDFTNQLDTYTDRFTAGVDEPATDDYDPVKDVSQPPPPNGKHVEMRTMVDVRGLTKDYRADLEVGVVKTWEITLIAYDPKWDGLSGTNTISWSLDMPDNVQLTLVDYGMDASRTNVVEEVDISENNYDFEVSDALDAYRYIDLKAELG